MASKPADSERGKCPVCGRPSVDEYRPFCSRRCADVDLARWLSGAYVIPERTEGSADDAGPPPAPADGENGKTG